MPRPSAAAASRGASRTSSLKQNPATSTPSSSSPSSKHSGVTTVTIPLNDDAAEKAKRNQNRQALHDIQMNKIVAAATPRKGGDQNALYSSPGGTPNQQVNVVGQQTPAKKVPILANFEEWMKMVTDNKINATNSWNFALIDYFHDMSLLKEGNSINFQKASCTLDGCVKIYTSRVDSVATETGKLLSGLADSGSKSKKDGNDNAEDEDGDDEEAEKKRQRRKAQRSEATLVKDFSALQLKKFELEFSVDPLFKKLAADFDEGGAKGLLLNHLAIDDTGRIMFDSSDDANENALNKETGENDEEDAEGEEAANETVVTVKEEEDEEDIFIDVQSLGAKYIPDLAILEEQFVCPSLKDFSLDDPSGSLDIPFLKAMTEKEEEELAATHENIGDDDDDDDFAGGGFDIAMAGDGDETQIFGHGGEAWANENMPNAANLLMTPRKGVTDAMDIDGNFDANTSDFIVRLNDNRGAEEEDILAYFDEALKRTWAGPEHWRITRLKDNATRKEPAARPRREKIPFSIDFNSPNEETDDYDLLFATSNASITMPRTQWASKTRNLLPDDKHFNSKQLVRLFLKPKAMLRSRKQAKRGLFGDQQQAQMHGDEVMDEQFWAQNEIAVTSTPEGQAGTYDANFFHDELPGADLDDDDDDAFADAREIFSPDGDGLDPNGNAIVVISESDTKGPEGFGSQLVTSNRRVRPEYVQYARVAKKVDVRKLKENMWKGLYFESIDLPPPPVTPGRKQLPTPPPADNKSAPPEAPEIPRKFTEIINGLQTFYPKQALQDISTSYCFISLLHLANEKGLVITGDGTLKELDIRRDMEAETGGEY